MIKKVFSIILRFFFLFSGIILALVLIEISLRIYFNKKIIPIGTSHNILPYVLKKNTKGQLFADNFFIVKTNSKGLRDKEYTYKRNSKKRILIIGDSYGFGYGIEQNKTFSAVLETQYFNNKVEIINACIPGYSTTDEYIYYITELYKYHPDIIILQFFINDIYGNMKKNNNKSQLIIKNNSLVLSFPKNQSNIKIKNKNNFKFEFKKYIFNSKISYIFSNLLKNYFPSGMKILAKYVNKKPYAQYNIYKNVNSFEEGWTLFDFILKEFNSLAKKNHFKIILLYAPSPIEVSSKAWDNYAYIYSLNKKKWLLNAPAKKIGKICKRYNIYFIDPTAQLKKEEKSGKKTYLPYDLHFNKHGHKVIAQMLYNDKKIQNFLNNN